MDVDGSVGYDPDILVLRLSRAPGFEEEEERQLCCPF
jgi:hypothetical protein